MSNGSSLATFCCFTTVAALGFFLFGGRDATWCYVVGSICLLPVFGVVIYAGCIYPCKEKRECCYAEESCKEYCFGYEEEPAPKTKTKPKKALKQKSHPKPSAPPQELEEMGTAPPILELREVVVNG
jgi:hypothetical protein